MGEVVGMKRNPVVPFVIIMVLGIGLMFLLSFKGLGDSKQIAENKQTVEKQKHLLMSLPNQKISTNKVVLAATEMPIKVALALL